MNTQSVSMDFDKAFYFARKGIQRAAIFAGIVLGEENSLDIKTWHIKNNFRLLAGEIDENNKNENISEFKNWAVRNALCEMMEFFDYSLKGIYEHLYLIDKWPEQVNLRTLPKEVNKFHKDKNGFPSKLNKINRLLGDKLSSQKDFWEALQKIRNCITHNIGIVDRKSIKIKVPKLSIILKMADGKEKTLAFDTIIDRVIYPAEELSIKFEYITKTYKRGDYITFTNDEVIHIIWAMTLALSVFERAVLQNAFENNIPLFDKSNNQKFTTFEEFEVFQKAQKEKQNNANQ